MLGIRNLFKKTFSEFALESKNIIETIQNKIIAIRPDTGPDKCDDDVYHLNRFCRYNNHEEYKFKTTLIKMRGFTWQFQIFFC